MEKQHISAVGKVAMEIIYVELNYCVCYKCLCWYK